MPVSAGSYTVGVAGTYPDWAAALADIVSPLTGDLTFTQISSFATASHGTLSLNFASFKLELTSNMPHLGIAANGWETELSGTGIFLAVNALGANPGIFEAHNLYFRSTGSVTSIFQNLEGTTAQGYSYRVHDNLGDLNAITSFFHSNGNGRDAARVWNIIAWNPAASGTNSVIQTRNGCITENVTIYGTLSIDGMTAAGGEVPIGRNNAIFLPPARLNFRFWNFGGTLENNASKDATAIVATTQSGGLINLDEAIEFASLNPADPDFLVPIVTGSIWNGGTAPGIPWNTAGIEGDPRPALGGRVAMGAFQRVVGLAPAASGSLIIPVWVPGI